jgi:hypothetical protein
MVNSDFVNPIEKLWDLQWCIQAQVMDTSNKAGFSSGISGASLYFRPFSKCITIQYRNVLKCAHVLVKKSTVMFRMKSFKKNLLPLDDKCR